MGPGDPRGQYYGRPWAHSTLTGVKGLPVPVGKQFERCLTGALCPGRPGHATVLAEAHVYTVCQQGPTMPRDTGSCNPQGRRGQEGPQSAPRTDHLLQSHQHYRSFDVDFLKHVALAATGTWHRDTCLYVDASGHPA